MTKRVLFLNPPSFEGFDGGAGSRYQAKREVRSFWYPTWLAQAAAFIPGSRVLAPPVEEKDLEDTIQAGQGFDLIIVYTSTGGFLNDAKLAQGFREKYPTISLAMVGPHTTAMPEESLRGCQALDFVVRGEFDTTLVDIANEVPLAEVDGISYRRGNDIIHNRNRRPLQEMDSLPSVLDVYKRDLPIEKYFVGYLLHPYLSLYTGRGCPGRCTFCLWPQTIGGQKYRARSPRSVIEEMKRAKDMFPQVKEYFFDDDTFTANLQRVEEIARGLKGLDIVWSCSTRANLGERTLGIMKDSGLRCLVVGMESGSDEILKNIRKGISTAQMHRFMKICKHLKIMTHGTFIVGLPGETKASIEQTIQYAKELDPDTIQVAIATPYPGTEFYRQAIQNGWIRPAHLVSCSGIQQVSVQYQDLSHKEIFDAVEEFYHRYYFRPKPIIRILRTMITDKDTCLRRLREANEFFRFLQKRKKEEKTDSLKTTDSPVRQL